MAISGGRGQRFSAIIWPGFVDVMTALILVLFFVLSIFMIVQFVLRDTITGQGRQLDELSVQVANLADALGLERSRADRQEALVTTLTGERDAAAARIAALTGEVEAAAARIADFEAQVASLIARNTDLDERLSAAQTESAERLEPTRRCEAALAQARGELDAGVEAARLAAARREALEALVASLRTEVGGCRRPRARTAGALGGRGGAADRGGGGGGAARRLESADAELTAMTLALEAERRKAEETLTLLAAAEAAKEQLEGRARRRSPRRERRAAELAQANIAALRAARDLGRGPAAGGAPQPADRLAPRAARRAAGTARRGGGEDAAAQVQIESLGQNLNAALARVAVEERRRAELEAARARAAGGRGQGPRALPLGVLRADARDPRRARGGAGGRRPLRLPLRGAVRAGLGDARRRGQAQVARVASVIREIADDIPPEIDWVLRVDGHTDATPVSATSPFADNWELSLARALSVVRYMIEIAGPAGRPAGGDRLRRVPPDRPRRQPGGLRAEPEDRAEVHRAVRGS